ncbi:MAG: hypothetical protein KGL53_11520 [Elusimicrobia bacterium]|nr:hypothetical protein [Elusimicrobiota bacterium]
MVTIFTTCKPLRGQARVHQRNALASWSRLRPRCRIIIFDEAEGVAEAAREFGAELVTDLPRGPGGRPLMDAVYARVREMSDSEVLCPACSDVILFDDWLESIRRVHSLGRPFLLTGRHRPARVEDDVDLSRPGAADRLKGLPFDTGHYGLDIAAFRRDTYVDVPPFIFMDFFWDSWTVFEGRRRGYLVVDADQCANIVHQEHPRAAWDVSRLTPAQRYNVEQAGGIERMFGVIDATHRLTPDGPAPMRSLAHLRRTLLTWPALHPSLRPLSRALEGAFRLTRPLRHRIGLKLPPD